MGAEDAGLVLGGSGGAVYRTLGTRRRGGRLVVVGGVCPFYLLFFVIVSINSSFKLKFDASRSTRLAGS